MTEKKPDNINKITVQPEGSMSVSRAADGSIAISSSEPLMLSAEKIKAVSIHNLVEVASHTISQQVGFVSHLVTFHDGGTVEFAYNAKGQVVSLVGTKVTTTVQNGNQVEFRMKRPS